MIPVNEPLFAGNEKKYLLECIETGWISSEGPFVGKFEEEFAEHVGRKHGVAVCNGSAALDVAVAALEIGQGDEVILGTFTIISCAASIVRAGATPVVVDTLADTWNMDWRQIEEKITDKTRAIMVPHIYGLPAEMDRILKIASRRGLFIIEDAAEMIGQDFRDKACGSFGDISTFSFYPNKHVTTGEGGMVLTDDDVLAERCRSLRNLCFQKKRFYHEKLGWNMRMSNIQAALGVAQLENLEESVNRKRGMGRLYNDLLKDLDSIKLPIEKTEYAENIYWVYGVVLEDSVPFDAEEMMKRLGEKRIGTRPFFWPMHEQPVFRKMGLFDGVSMPVAENLARRGLYIPSGLSLTDEQIHQVAKAVREDLA